MSASSSPVVRLEGVSQRFGGRAALSDVTLTVEPGEFVAVVGRSGAGKTTLLRCLSRSVVATSGRVRFGSRDVGPLHGRALRAHRAGVGVIYQQFNLIKRLRVLDNVLVGRLSHLRGFARVAALAGHFGVEDRDISLRCLDHVGLLIRAWQRTDTLSGGEQQRVAIAKILAQAPSVILADEPVASLDVANAAMVMEMLRRVASETGLTVIATLHHVDYARRYADRVLGLKAGRLVVDGPAAALTDVRLSTIFGEPPAAQTPREAPGLAPVELVAG